MKIATFTTLQVVRSITISNPSSAIKSAWKYNNSTMIERKGKSLFSNKIFPRLEEQKSIKQKQRIQSYRNLTITYSELKQIKKPRSKLLKMMSCHSKLENKVFLNDIYRNSVVI